MILGKLPFRSDLSYELDRLVKSRGIAAGMIQVTGSLRHAKLGCFDQKNKAYSMLDFDGSHEIVSGTGNISLRDDEPFVHLHLAIADSEGKVYGGHCIEGCSVYAVEYIIIPAAGISPRRVRDPETSLYLWEEESYSTEEP